MADEQTESERLALIQQGMGAIEGGLGSLVAGGGQMLRDPRELAFKDIVTYLFDFSKLLFVSRLSADMAMTIIRNKIVIYYFQDYYSKIKVKSYLMKVDYPPFYKKVMDYGKTDEIMMTKLLANYPKILEETMAITVSIGGRGRTESLDILRSANNELEKKSMLPFNRG